MKARRKIIEIDESLCDGCGQCAIACAEGAIAIIDGKARVISESYCDGLGACLGECPQGAITIVEREADEFDEQAVHAHLKEQQQWQEAEKLSHQCPSARTRQFAPAGQTASTQDGPSRSELTTWPVQLRLVAHDAPFLQGADLLVAADCTAFAYPDIHRDFFKGRVVLCGCPKFDDQAGCVQKFTEIFKRNAIKSVTVLIMEVPCCGGMPIIIQKAMDAAGTQVPMETVTIGIEGGIIRRGA
jgi:ferredoxin